MNVRLEPVAPAHAAAMQALAADPAVLATTNLPSPYPPGAAAEWIGLSLLQRRLGLEYGFAIFAATTLVGSCALVAVTRSGAEFGYWIGRPYWGRGYATAAGRLALDFARSALGLPRLRANCLETNTASRRVLEKLGFRRCRRVAAPPGPRRWGPEQRFLRYRLEWCAHEAAGTPGIVESAAPERARHPAP